MAPDMEESIRCTVPGCGCACFKPGRVHLRSCDRCGHGWVAHALEKLQAQPPSSCGPVEVALPGLVFDLSSLVLYGAQAIPVRLKILLDRLYSILTPEQVNHILHTLGWSLGDYVRGYMQQYSGGKALDRWLMVTPEEELLILKQFLRFGETRPIVELMTLHPFSAFNHFSDAELNPVPNSCQSNISTFIERNGRTPGGFRNTRGDSCLVASVCRFEKNSPADCDTLQHFENFPSAMSLLLPANFASSAVRCLAPSSKLVPPTKVTQYVQNPSGTKLTQRHRLDGERGAQVNNVILPQSKDKLALKIKVDPDKSNPAQSPWHQKHKFSTHQDPDLHRGLTKQENSSLSPTSNSSLIPSPSLYPPISSSPLKSSQKLQEASSPSLHSLPSFSSSFFCSPPTSPFSSSLHPLPSSLCSLSSSLTGGRKGRVCCGVCGKSFYDKGTLKIHYNAVHLKIKHRCTVPGCTMVFSSLRSRNRHSANPNPRLHTGANKDAHIHRNFETHTDEVKNEVSKNVHNTNTRMCREQKAYNTRWQDDGADTLGNGFLGRTVPQHGTPSRADSPPSSPHPLPQTLSQDTHQSLIPNDSTNRSDLYPQNKPPHPILPAHSASSLGSPPSLVPLVTPAVEKPEHCHRLTNHTCHTAPAPFSGPIPVTLAHSKNQSASCENGVAEGKEGDSRFGPVTNTQKQWESGLAGPKKKPRKSSMPVKIERQKIERRRNKEEE